MKLRGFTLVEVMVALAIVAVALPALLMALARQMDDTGYMRDKSVAQMVAANKLAEMRLVIGSTRTLQAGSSNGFDTMVDRDWYWWVQTQPTPVDRFFRIEISVALDEESQDQPLYQLTAFMNSDLAIDEEEELGFGDEDDPTDPNNP
jgi:general secretion pathway protein I